MAFIHNRSIGSLYRQYHICQYRYTSQWASTECQHTINRASTEHEHSVNWVSTECQRFWVLHHVYSNGAGTAYVHNERIGRCSVQMGSWQVHCMSENERQQSVNDFVCCILYNPRAVQRHLSKIGVLAAFIGIIVFVNTITPQNERQQSVNTASTERHQSINPVTTECQQSVNAFGCCIMYIPRDLLRNMSIINVLEAILCKCDRDMVSAPVWKWESTQCQRFCVLHLVYS